MERFRPFFGCPVNRKGLDDPAVLEEAGLEARYLPAAFESFDEMEFMTSLEGDKKLVLSIALEEGKIMRILFGWAGPDDPEDTLRSLEQADLTEALDQHGEALTDFFKKITD